MEERALFAFRSWNLGSIMHDSIAIQEDIIQRKTSYLGSICLSITHVVFNSISLITDTPCRPQKTFNLVLKLYFTLVTEASGLAQIFLLLMPVVLKVWDEQLITIVLKIISW